MKNEVYVILFLCGLGDFLTTYIGLGLGYSETRLLGAVPFLSTVLFCVVVWFIRLLKGPWVVKDMVCFVLVLVAFSGFAYNFAGLLGVTSFRVLG
jgi:uncharacterized membrane protein YccC